MCPWFYWDLTSLLDEAPCHLVEASVVVSWHGLGDGFMPGSWIIKLKLGFFRICGMRDPPVHELFD